MLVFKLPELCLLPLLRCCCWGEKLLYDLLLVMCPKGDRRECSVEGEPLDKDRERVSDKDGDSGGGLGAG